MKKYIVLVITLLTLFSLIHASVVKAQNLSQSNCAITQIGSFSGPSPTLPPECNTSSSSTALGNNVADLANKLAAAAQDPKNNCNGSPSGYGYLAPAGLLGTIAKGQDSECLVNVLNQIFPTNGGSAQEQIKASTNDNYYYQCVGFIETVITGVYGSPLASSNAIDFTHDNNFGYKYISRDSGVHIQPGDIPIWRDPVLSDPGHIAIALEVKQRVDSSGQPYDMFRVAEANVCFKGWVNNNVTPQSDCTDGHYGIWRTTDFTYPNGNYALEGWLHKP